MTKKNREAVTALFAKFMDEQRESYREDYSGLDREYAWIIRSPFGPISVTLAEPDDHREGFTLFCQVLLFPSTYPNGIKPWYQFDHWKQNCHLTNHPDVDVVYAALNRHVMRFFSIHEGTPTEHELMEQMLTHAATSTNKARTLLRYFKHYDEKNKAVVPGAVGKPTLEPVGQPELAGSVS